ncbi:TPA: restriction endonuclease subunit S [Streptococcus suis]|nr:restriction endonuclease subunit S [Streptococcus suis]HEM4148349.1 restriction endonuclease subunit S [Streptococcus suis]
MRKLGEVAKYRNGKAHEQSIVAEGDYVVINSKFVSTGGVVEKFSSRQLEPLYKNEIAFVLSDIPNGKALSKTFLVDVDQKYTLNQRIAAITPKESASFLNELLNRNSYFLKFDNGVGQTNLAKDQVLEFNAFFPSLPEQETIGTFFSTLDQHITLHQRKLDKLKHVKQAYLSEMFPAEGERMPKRRFPGFTDAWELRKLGELGTLKNGMNFSKDAMGIGFPFINLQNIFGKNIVDVSQLGLAKASSIQLKNYNLQKGDVLFVRSSVKLEGVGEAAIVPKNLENTTYSGFIIRYRDSFGLDYNFKRFIFGTSNIRNQIMSQATDSANKNISQQVLTELDILVPTLLEQNAIGTFFSILDQQITLHQRKLEKLKNLKKALLNELFV